MRNSFQQVAIDIVFLFYSENRFGHIGLDKSEYQVNSFLITRRGASNEYP